MGQDILVVGAGGFAREVAWLIEDINHMRNIWEFLGFVEKSDTDIGKTVGSHSVVMSEEQFLSKSAKVSCVIGIGNPKTLFHVSERLRQKPNIIFPNLVHPNVIMHIGQMSLGIGNIICAGNIFTTDIKIGSMNIFNLSSTFGHDVIIGDCNVINPGTNISNGVIIGDCCLIGTGAVILENLKLGNNVIVEGGSVVTTDIPDGTAVVGVPAKPVVKENKHENLIKTMYIRLFKR